jgi:hypothetical protein
MNKPAPSWTIVLSVLFCLAPVSSLFAADPPADEKLKDAKPAETKPADQLEITVDTSDAPDLKEYGERIQKLSVEWYPKLVAMLPSEGYTAPRKILISFRKDYKGVAATMGTRIVCNVDWFTKRPEDTGAILHELTHVVQHYTKGKRPGWLVEGIADYIRWYKCEPGKDRTRKDPNKVKYTDSYRVTANFLNWAQEKYDKDLVVKLNAACREARYSDELWKQYTGKTADELGEEWKAALKEAAAAPKQ